MKSKVIASNIKRLKMQLTGRMLLTLSGLLYLLFGIFCIDSDKIAPVSERKIIIDMLYTKEVPI